MTSAFPRTVTVPCAQGMTKICPPIPRLAIHNPNRTTKKMAYAPSVSAAQEFRQSFRAHNAVRELDFALRATDVDSILYSQNQELIDAALDEPKVKSVLPARRVAVNLLLNKNTNTLQCAHDYYDGLQHFANSALNPSSEAFCVASHLRFAIFNAQDAETFKKSHEALDETSTDGTVQLAVCWAEKSTVEEGHVVKVAYYDIPTDLTARQFVVRTQGVLQNFSFTHSVAVSTDVFSDRGNVPVGSFSNIQAHNSEHFAKLFDSVVHTERSPFATAERQIKPVEDLFVRISVFDRGDAGLSDATAHHGMLLCDVAHVEAVKSFWVENACCLPVPTNVQNHYCIHVCAVQYQPIELLEKASSFAAGVPPGIPAPVFRAEVAVVPLERALSIGMRVTPCPLADLLPRGSPDQQGFINEAFIATHERLSEGLAAFAGFAPTRDQNSPTHAVLPGRNLDLGAAGYAIQAIGMRPMCRSNVYALDALSALSQTPDTPSEVTNFLKAGLSSSFAVSTNKRTVLQMFQDAADMLSISRSLVDVQSERAEMARLKRAAELVMAVGTDKHNYTGRKRKKDYPVGDDMNYLVETLIGATMVSDCLVPPKPSIDNMHEFVSVIQRQLFPGCVSSSATQHASELAARSVQKANGVRGVTDAIAAVVGVLRACPESTRHFKTVYVFVHTKGRVEMWKVGGNGVIPCLGQDIIKNTNCATLFGVAAAPLGGMLLESFRLA